MAAPTAPLKKKAKTYTRNIVAYGLFTWIAFALIGLILGPLSFLLVITGRIRITGWSNIWRAGWKNVIWVANHPSYLDIWLPLVLLWPLAILWPFTFVPWQMPDKRNFKFLKNFRVFRGIAIDRGTKSSSGSMREILRALSNSVVLIFPEAGRTSSNPASRLEGLPDGVEIRIPSTGVAHIVSSTNPWIIPILIKGSDRVLGRGQVFPRFWRQIEITIGKPYKLTISAEGQQRKTVLQDAANEIMTRVGTLP